MGGRASGCGRGVCRSRFEGISCSTAAAAVSDETGGPYGNEQAEDRSASESREGPPDAERSARTAKQAKRSPGLSTAEKNDLPASAFAFPKERKEPLTDARHVRNAIARFDQVEDVSDAERDRAWERIKRAARGSSTSKSPRAAGASSSRVERRANAEEADDRAACDQLERRFTQPIPIRPGYVSRWRLNLGEVRRWLREHKPRRVGIQIRRIPASSGIGMARHGDPRAPHLLLRLRPDMPTGKRPSPRFRPACTSTR